MTLTAREQIGSRLLFGPPFTEFFADNPEVRGGHLFGFSCLKVYGKVFLDVLPPCRATRLPAGRALLL
ncbi:hypothetical protein [Deinococcus fonticola]|uniref:hypothetical protein n=1 Tax=Deinococcus fonticola TaxID=2528713 RepID=UPI001074EA74|nr:hypothetical protein [Deinococcus fonticola]